MPTITRRFEFDSAHRVLGHEGKCKHLHGHRYVAEVTVRSGVLDSLGRVIDFSVLKEQVGGWINANWDHNIILNPNDPLCRIWNLREAALEGKLTKEIFSDRNPSIMPNNTPNPTAENMAKNLFAVAELLMRPYKIEVVSVKLYETSNCWAVYPDK